MCVTSKRGPDPLVITALNVPGWAGSPRPVLCSNRCGSRWSAQELLQGFKGGRFFPGHGGENARVDAKGAH